MLGQCAILLELHYCIRYVLGSEENARRFHEDAICDYPDLLKMADSVIPPNTEAAIVFRNIRDHVVRLTTSMQMIKPKDRFLAVADVAKGLGEQATFVSLNKYLSKLAHPTSFWVQLQT